MERRANQLIACSALLISAFAPLPAAAEGLQHTWTLAKETEIGHVLVPDGEAKGKGVIALILPEKPIGAQSIPEAFDATITDHLKSATAVHGRVDYPRRTLFDAYLLRTFLHYKTVKGDERIAIFIARPKVTDTTLRIVRTNGPNDTALMLHYESDIREVAAHPDDAIGGKIKTRDHEALAPPKPVATINTKQSFPKAAPIRPKADLVKPTNSVWHGNVWGFKTYSNAVRWWVRDFNNTIGYSSYSITLYDPKPLNGQSVEDWLKAEATAQEKDFHKTIQRGHTRTWRPFWVGLYNVYQDIDGDNFGAQYDAMQVGTDTARMVLFLMTDHGFYKEEFTEQSAAVRKHMMASADQAYIFPLIKAHSDQLAEERRERERLAAEEANRKRIAAEEEAKRKRLEAEAAAKRNAELATRWTEPGEGLKMSEIEAITHYAKRYASYDTGVDIETTTWLLLKDGTAYYNPWIPPSDFNVEASRKVEPDRWSTWNKVGNEYSTRGKIAEPGTERHIDFDGRLIRTWGTAGYGSGFEEHRIILYPNGRFYNSAFNMMQGGGVVVSSSNNGSGRTSTASSGTAPHLLNSSDVSEKNGTDNRGTYAIDGYTIEFLSDSGKSRRSIYVRHGEDAVYIAGTHYTDEK